MPKLSEIATGEKIGNIIDEAVTIQGGATTSTTPAVRTTREDSSTDTAPPVLALRRSSTGTPATGIGAGLDFEVETAASHFETGVSVQAVTTDVTDATEDFDLVVKTMAAGAAVAESGRFLSYGGLKLPPAIGNNASLQIHNWGLRKHTDNNRLGVTVDNNAFVAMELSVGYAVSLNHGYAFSSGNPIAATGSASITTGIYCPSAGMVEINNGTVGSYRDLTVRKHYVDATNTAGGTTGNQTINKAAGTVNFAAAATTLTVTNSLVTTASIVFCVVRTDDTTATIKNAVPGSGSFVITLTAAATAETSVGFFVIN